MDDGRLRKKVGGKGNFPNGRLGNRVADVLGRLQIEL